MRWILVVDDHAEIREVVAAYLEREGFGVVSCGDAHTALQAFGQRRFDLAILDLMLPDQDGYSLCRQLRRSSDLPILMLSARDDPMDRVLGLEVGADDFVSKPFHAPEVVMRVHGLLRRVNGAARTPALKRGELALDPDSRRATLAERPLALTRREFDLLLLFATHPGQVLTREQVLERLGEDLTEADPRVVDSHLRNLRSKLRAALPSREFIRAIRGVGYRFD